MRTAARTDANHTEIVRAFRDCGFSVTDTSGVGNGFPDIVVGKYGRTLPVEIKDGSKPPSKQQLTVDQLEWHATWRGSKAIVRSVDDVLNISREWMRRLPGDNAMRVN